MIEPHFLISLGKRCECDRSTIKRLIERGELKPVESYSVGKRGIVYRFDSRDLDKLRAKNLEARDRKVESLTSDELQQRIVKTQMQLELRRRQEEDEKNYKMEMH